MGAAWEAQRHEDSLTSGIPDLSYSMNVNGWIELKYLRSKPAKDDTILKIEHYTPEQRNWLIRHGSKSGLCWLLLQVESVYMIFDWTKANKVGKLNYEQHIRLSNKTWIGRIAWSELREVLSHPVKP